MTIDQAVKLLQNAFAKITSEENKHKKFNNIIDFMLSLYYGGKQPQNVLEKENEIFQGCINVQEAKDYDAYMDCVLTITDIAKELPFTDVLGEFYQIEISKADHEQIFTPDAVSYLMAKTTLEGNIRKDMGINDDCVGCGRLLLAGAKYIAEQQKETNVRVQDVMFIGKDLDDRCVRITLLNMCLNGLKGIVTCGDTLLNTVKYRIFVDYTFPRVNGKGAAMWCMGKMSQWWQMQAQPAPAGCFNGQSQYKTLEPKQEPAIIAQVQTEPKEYKPQLTLF